jgi:hypothetical protein
MPVIGALNISFSLIRLSYSIDLTNPSYWKPCLPLGSVPSATPKKFHLSGWFVSPFLLIMALAPLFSCRRSQRYVIANDLSPSATTAMARNVELNGLGGDGNGPDTAETGRQGKVRVNQGDAR